MSENKVHKQLKKDLVGGSFLWPFMLLANNIGDFLSIIRIPEQHAYWIALVLFFFVGVVGLVFKFVGKASKEDEKTPKDEESAETTREVEQGESEWKKYGFWRELIKDVFAFWGGALYIASDNLPLLFDLDIDDYVDTLQLVRASYLRNYLLAITLLIVGMSHAIPLVLDPIFGRDQDKKIIDKYQKLKNKSLGISFKTQPRAQGEQEATDSGVVHTNKRNERGMLDASETLESIQGSPLPAAKESADELLEMIEENVLLPTATPWQQFLESLSLFMVLAALSDQFYGAIISEITQDDANVTSGMTCPIAHATAGIIFYSILSGFWVISVSVTVFIGAVKWRKFIKRPTTYCLSFEYIIIVFVVASTLVYLPLYMAADNIWPWVCLAFRNETVPVLQVVRYVLIPISFLITIWLLAVQLVFVSWPLRLLKYKRKLSGEEHWYHGYRPKYVKQALRESKLSKQLWKTVIARLTTTTTDTPQVESRSGGKATVEHQATSV